ncbi:MAG TPA: histidine phosphatase family protein, partial [Bacillota bacterium]|nr:histidine phosphatase family protein [Bacillota bacterium]
MATGPGTAAQPEVTRVILVRHAQHDPGDRFRQHSCTGLTDHGRDQAERLARRLRDHHLGIDTVVTSRAARTIETGAAVAEALGIVPAAPTCDLCEMHPGEAEGLTVAEMQQRWGRNYAAVPGAQYFPDWLPGAQRRLRVLAEQHRGRTVLAVTHNAVVRVSFLAFAGM